MSRKIAIASLSYDPATDREMYPGTIPMNAAASSAAEGVAISSVNLIISLPPLVLYQASDSHVCRPCCQACKAGGQHDTDITDIDGHIDPAQEVPNQARSDHQSGVDCTSDSTSERVPRGWVEPIPEFLDVRPGGKTCRASSRRIHRSPAPW
jgi:hypothetical protein